MFVSNNTTAADAAFPPISASAISTSAASMSIDMYANTYLSDHPWLLILFVCALSITSVIGVGGNVMVIYAVMTDKFLRQPANLLVTNVAIADIVIAGILNPFNIIGAVYGYELFRDRHWLCILVGSLCVPVCTSSLYNLALIAFSRYIHVCRNKWYRKLFTWKSSFALCLSVWIFSELLHLPNHIGWGVVDYGSPFYICSFAPRFYSYSIFWLTFGITIPFIVVVLSYWKIFLTIRRRNRIMFEAAATTAAVEMTAAAAAVAWSDVRETDFTQAQQLQLQQPAQTTTSSILSMNLMTGKRPVPMLRRQNNRPNEATAANMPVNGLISSNNLDTASDMNNANELFRKKRNNVRVVPMSPELSIEQRWRLNSFNERDEKRRREHHQKSSVTNEEVKLMKSLFFIVIAFFIGWYPFVGLVMLRIPAWVPGWFYVLSIFLAHAQSAVNPVIYCCCSSHFRSVYKVKCRVRCRLVRSRSV